jgi:HEAT repeat protein
VEPLTQALKDESGLVRSFAITFLANMGVIGVDELLTKHLLDEDWFVRDGVAEALKRMSWKPQNKTEEAYYLIGKRKWKELEEIGNPAVQPLIQILKTVNSGVRENVRETLEKIGWKPQNATEHAYYLVAKQEWENLLDLGEPAVEPLIQALSDEGHYTREGAVRTLGGIGDKRAVEPLTRALEDEYVEVRREAAEALERMGWKPEDSNQQKYYLIGKQEWNRLADEFGESAIKPLMQFLKDKSSSVQQGVAAALKKIGKPALEPLIQALKDKDYETRAGAAYALGQIGYSEAVEPLIQALKDKNADVRSSAAEALGNTRDKRAVKPLIYALNDGYNCVRQEAAYALGDINDGRALKPLTRILKEEKREYEEEEEEEEDEYEECKRGDVLEAVIYALGEIGGESVKKAFTDVVEDYSDEDVSESAEENLRELREEEMPKALKKAFKTSTNLELSDNEEFYDEWVLTYDVKKKNSKYYLPINVKIDLEQEIFPLCCELWCGLHDVGEDETVKGIADWLRGYANQIRKDAKNLQELGFQIVDKNIDGIHYLNFNYQKDYPPKKINELIKDLEKVVEKVY